MMHNNRYKVLIVEDESNIVNLITALLEANDYQAVSAKTCESGLMMFASHRPDLVLLDLGLPDVDGMDFLKKVRKSDLTPIIVLSARSDERDKVMTYSAIIKEIWGYNDLNSTKKLQVNMANIRKKFGAKPEQGNYIVNELGVGYRMRECDD